MITYICLVSTTTSVSSEIETSELFSELTLAALDINTLASELAVNISWSWKWLNLTHQTLKCKCTCYSYM